MADNRVQILKEEVLFKKDSNKKTSLPSQKKWKERLVVLTGGTVYLYSKKTNMPTLRKSLELFNCTIEPEADQLTKRPFSFGLHSHELTIFLSAPTQSSKDEWLVLLNENLGRSPSPPPSQYQNKALKHSVPLKGRFSSAAISLPGGIKVLREFVGNDILSILDAMKSFISNYENKEIATKVEKYVLKLGIQAALLYRSNKIPKSEFPTAKSVIHKACDKLIDGYELSFGFDVAGIITSFRNFQVILDRILRCYLSEDDHKKLVWIFDYFTQENLLMEFYNRINKHTECKQVNHILRKLWDAGLV